MNVILKTQHITLEPCSSRRLASLCGQFDEHLRQIERQFHVEIKSRGNLFQLTGELESIEAACHLLLSLYQQTSDNKILTPDEIHLAIQECKMDKSSDVLAFTRDMKSDMKPAVQLSGANIKPRGKNQKAYIQNILQYDINFGIGPAGTGKTYLAVASAVNALKQNLAHKILLVRPAVEAGEKLGFLPGDMVEKVNPYLRPLYDALYDMLSFEQVNKYIDRQIIEVVPLAYMRGRTLNQSFIILDESQNTTPQQMKMFLTRIGFGSKAVITGDQTQVDLPKGIESGLDHALKVLSHVDGICFNYFEAGDIVRHQLVQKIVDAYDQFERMPEKSPKLHDNA